MWYAELIDKEQCAGSEDAVRERINKLMDEWTYLTRKSSEKGEKLQEANRQRMYTAAVKDLEFWLGEVGFVLSFSMCKKLLSVLLRSGSCFLLTRLRLLLKQFWDVCGICMPAVRSLACHLGQHCTLFVCVLNNIK